jgi:ABC-type transport system substrate-binding protein
VVPLAQTALAQDARPDLLRVSRISDFLPSIHPTTLGTGNQELMADIVFSTLVDVDSDEVTILPDLAESWTVSEDATTYTFNLNPAAVWSDGEPVTADDVLYTIAYANQRPGRLQVPQRVRVPERGRRRRVLGTTDIPSGIKKIDDHTVEIDLKAPDSTFLRKLAGAVYYIMPEHVLGAMSAARGRALRLLPGRGRHRRRFRPVRPHDVDLRDRRRLHGPRRTTGRARTARSRRSTTASRSRTSPWPSRRRGRSST